MFNDRIKSNSESKKSFNCVSDPPMFIKRPEDVAGDENERITLTCLVDANPKPTYAWYRLPSPFEKDGKRQLVGNAANLSFIVTPSLLRFTSRVVTHSRMISMVKLSQRL